MDASFHGPRNPSDLDKPDGMKEIRSVRSLIFHGLGSCYSSAEASHFRKARIALDATLPKWSFQPPSDLDSSPAKAAPASNQLLQQ